MENIEKCKLNTYEYKGYVLEQTSYNWHYMIFKKDSGRCVLHASCTKKLNEKEAKRAIDLCLELITQVDTIADERMLKDVNAASDRS